MRAILINPFKREVTEVNTDTSLDDIYNLIRCDTITVVPWDEDHALFLDDEGLLKAKEDQAYWRMLGVDQPFAGRGLIIGDEYGENRDATLSALSVLTGIEFLDPEDVDPDSWTGWTISTAF